MTFTDEIIQEYENRVNNEIDTAYNTFYIQPYRRAAGDKYGVIFNGEQIALCETLQALEQVIRAVVFLLRCEGVKK